MPLDQAVYSATQDKIYGVRGGYVYEFDPGTGEKTNSARIGFPCWGDSSIAFDSGTGKLFVTQWNEQKWNDSGSANYDQSIYKKIIKIDPATLAVDASSYLTSVAPWAAKYLYPYSGPHQVIAYGGLLYLIFVQVQNTVGLVTILMAVNPSTLAISTYNSVVANYANNAWIDLCVQPSASPAPANPQLWMSTSASAITPYDTSDLTYGSSPYYEVNTTTAYGAPPYPVGYGMCWAANVGRIYSTTRSQRVIYITPKASNPGTGATFNTGDTTATPYRCRYCGESGNPFYQKILIPGLASDNVVVVNPSDNSCTIKTGFDSPLDVVFTPTKNWAVQQGAIGLKEIV